MAKKNQQAKKMATAGKSAAQIKAKTGVGSQTAQKYVAKQAPAPST
jgi:transposase